MRRSRAEVASKRAETKKLLDAGVGRLEIERRTGVTLSTLRVWYGRSDVVTQYPPELKELAKEMADNGASYANINRSLGVSETTLLKWFGPSLFEKNTAEAHKERSRRARERYERMVRLRMQDGLTNQQIADVTGINSSTVYHYLGATPQRLGGRRTGMYGLRERARFLREVGHTVTEIAEEMDLPRSTVGGWVKGMPC